MSEITPAFTLTLTALQEANKEIKRLSSEYQAEVDAGIEIRKSLTRTIDRLTSEVSDLKEQREVWSGENFYLRAQVESLTEVLHENGITVDLSAVTVSEEQTCKHERWQETYAGANCPDCGKEF